MWLKAGKLTFFFHPFPPLFVGFLASPAQEEVTDSVHLLRDLLHFPNKVSLLLCSAFSCFLYNNKDFGQSLKQVLCRAVTPKLATGLA